MSLVNDVLKDLQTRQAVGAHPLAGLRPADRSVRSVPWRAAAGGILVLALGTTAWSLDAFRRPPVSNPNPAPTTAVAEQTGSMDPVPGSTAVAVTGDASVAPSGVARTLRLASVTDFADSRRAMPATPRARPDDRTTKHDRVSPATPVARAHRPAAVSPHATTAVARDEQLDTRPGEPQLSANAGLPPRVVVKRADAASPAELAYRRGEAAMGTGDVDGAVAAFTTAVDLDASRTDAWRRLSSTYLDAGRIDLAVAALRRGVATADAPNELRLVLARVLVDAGRDAAALSVLEPAIAAPDRAPALAAFRAAVLQRMDRHEESAALYETLVALRPQEGAWWVGLGIARETLGHAGPALSAYRRATLIAPTPPSLARYADQRIARLQSRSQ